MEQLPDFLTSGAAALGVTLSSDQVSALVDYLNLLAKWNAKLNLVGPGTTADWAVRHVLDLLAPLPWLTAGQTVLDIGSGAGLPGIPLAVAAENTPFTLLEPRSNRVAFLQTAIAALRLKNAKVKRGRAEDEEEQVPFVVGRAVAPPEEYATLAAACLEPGGRFVLFHQQEPPEKLPGAERIERRTYEIQGSQPRTVGLYRVFHVEH